MVASWKESNDKPRQCIEKQRHDSSDKGPYSQGYGLPSDHVGLGELDCKVGRMPKKLMPSDCGAEEASWKSHGQQVDQTSQA